MLLNCYLSILYELVSLMLCTVAASKPVVGLPLVAYLVIFMDLLGCYLYACDAAGCYPYADML